ncbi:MAG TPA: HNH endonuclease [Planctomycetaceae bacterium]|jgi:putative restriction endonuclease
MQVISSDGTITDCILFLWTITGGGGGVGVRPAKERRVQITGASGIPLEPGPRTLLGGWSEDAQVYAFWDARRHVRFAPTSSKSPSLQVRSTTLEAAHQVGIATNFHSTAMGKEVVVGVNPDSLLWYVQQGGPLHNSEEDSTGVAELISATPEDERAFLDESANTIQASRRVDLVTLMRLFRDSKFAPEVLRAYRHKCAVCQYALKLVDAAHIVPVAYPQSTDEVTNGIALCRLHHGAYDNGLLGIRSDYSIITNPDAENRLTQLSLQTGFDDFKSRLPARIIVPPEIEIRPDPQKLILGLKARRWPDSLVV